MINIKLDLDKTILAIFFALLLFIAPASLFDYKIAHDFPYAYLASDAFQHQVRAEAVKDAGNFRYEAPYISHGFEKIIGRYPPLIYHLGVVFSYSTGLEVYDSIHFIVFFFAIIGILIMYLIMKDFNKNIALISLPLAALTFSHPNMIGFTWGHWPSVIAQSFLIAFFWFAMKIELSKFYIPAAIIFSAVLLAHTSEGVFGFIFVLIFFAIKFIGRNLKKVELKNLVLCLFISLILSLHYLIIFQFTWNTASYVFAVEPIWQDNPGFYIKDFGILLIFITVGIISSLFKIMNMHVSLIAAISMLVSGFLNYIGFGLRSFQIRFFWPIYLSVFFGLGIYMLFKFAIKKWNITYSMILAIIFTILLFGLIELPYIPKYIKTTSQGLMDQYHWQAFEWISKNTEANAKLYFFYGDIYTQDALLRNSKRVHYQVYVDDFVNSIKDRKLKRIYTSELPGDSGGGIKVRKGLFEFEDISTPKPKEFFLGPQDICSFNYLIFDKISRQQVLAQYNLLIASELLKKDYISNAFENEVVVVLKNNKPGVDCIEERSF